MELVLEILNKHGFAFTRDYVLKVCLVLLDQGAGYKVEKFRRAGVREKIEEEWDSISAAMRDVLDYVRGKTFIQCDKALPAYTALIPLVYVRYCFPEAWKKAAGIDSYLLRSLLATVFGGSSDTLLDAVVKKLKESKVFDLEEVFGVLRTQGRSLELTEDRLWTMGYGSDNIHLLFNLWYRDFNHTPAYENNFPQIDHIFPQSALRKIKVQNPSTGRKDMLKYRDAERNQLANCMLLSREENGAGGKTDTLPEVWFTGKSHEYLAKHLIPTDPELWKLERFDDFIDARKALIREKFKGILVSTSPNLPNE